MLEIKYKGAGSEISGVSDLNPARAATMHNAYFVEKLLFFLADCLSLPTLRKTQRMRSLPHQTSGSNLSNDVFLNATRPLLGAFFYSWAWNVV